MKLTNRINLLTFICLLLFSQPSQVSAVTEQDYETAQESEIALWRAQNRLGEPDIGPEDPLRFKQEKPEDKNEIMLNANIYETKFAASVDDSENEIHAISAIAGTTYTWRFLFWKSFSYHASNAWANHNGYWSSNLKVQNDYWEAYFRVPTRINKLYIKWRRAPKRFKIYFKTNLNEAFIPATEVYTKYSYLTQQGTINSKNLLSMDNTIVFQKPIIASMIRIAMNEPINNWMFSISEVRFYKANNYLLIVNNVFDKCKAWCFYINNTKPIHGDNVEMYPCMDAISWGNNNELFMETSYDAIRHLNSNWCLGFNKAYEIVLVNCNRYYNPYTLQIRPDKSLFFKGYENRCIYIDNHLTMSPNYVDSLTEVITSSEYDQTYKTKNILMDSGSFWLSTPGESKVSLQLLFGKRKDGEIDSKKVDLIKLEWTIEPTEYSVYTWSPGQSWILRETFVNNITKETEITLNSVTAAGIMIVLTKSKGQETMGNLPVYGLSSVYIGANTFRLKFEDCKGIKDTAKLFNFETQSYLSNKNTEKSITELNNLTNFYEKISLVNKQLNEKTIFISSWKEHANQYINKITLLNSKEKTWIEQLSLFSSNSLNVIKKTKYSEIASQYGSILSDDDQGKSAQSLRVWGTDTNPGIDCFAIKQALPNVVSGFYYIQPLCSSKPIRVFCDFVSYSVASDYYVYGYPNQDLSYLNINSHHDIRAVCANHGLYPIEIMNSAMVNQLNNVLQILGFDMNRPQVVPLGYDYMCSNGNCSGTFKSFNDINSTPIEKFFEQNNFRDQKKQMIGLGFSWSTKPVFFNPGDHIMTGLVCSTNHFDNKWQKMSITNISCGMTVEDNWTQFKKNMNVIVKCPWKCDPSIGVVYGTSKFSVKSSICLSGIHAGLLTQESNGLFYLRVNGVETNFRGSSANGIQSKDYLDPSSMFTWTKYHLKCPAKSVKANPRSFWEMESKQFDKIRNEISSSVNQMTNNFLNSTNSANSWSNKALDILTPKNNNNNNKSINPDNHLLNPPSATNAEDPSNIMNSIEDNNSIDEDNENTANKCPSDTTSVIEQIKINNKKGLYKMIAIILENTDKIKNNIISFDTELSWSRSNEWSVSTIKNWIHIFYKNKDQIMRMINNMENAAQWRIEKSKSIWLSMERTMALKSRGEDFDMSKVLNFKSTKNSKSHEDNPMNTSPEAGNIGITSNNIGNFGVDISGRDVTLMRSFNFYYFNTSEKPKKQWQLFPQENNSIGILKERNARYSVSNIQYDTIIFNKFSKLYDFTLKCKFKIIDGTQAGIAFRLQNQFSFYAFEINGRTNEISIMNYSHGVNTVLAKSNIVKIDKNKWYSLKVDCRQASIQVKLYYEDTKLLELTAMNQEFVSGSFGAFTSIDTTFYFNSIEIKSKPCSKPWTKKQDPTIKVINPKASAMNEKFTSMLNRVKIIDAEENANGASEWSTTIIGRDSRAGWYQRSRIKAMKFNELGSYIYYTKGAQITNGIVNVSFIADDKDGIVSILFKYDPQTKITYRLDIKNTSDNKGSFVLGKIGGNGEFINLKSVFYNNKLKVTGYVVNELQEVQIEVNRGIINVFYANSGEDFVPIINNFKDDSIFTGTIGVGTSNTKCVFTNIWVSPIGKKSLVKWTETESTQGSGFESKSLSQSGSLSGSQSGSQTEINKWSNFEKNKLEDKIIKTNNNYKSDIINNKGKVCFKYKSNKERNKYCLNFTNSIKKTKCKTNFCDSCCDNEISEFNTNENRLCKKVCEKNSKFDDDNGYYQGICTNQITENSAYEACNEKKNSKLITACKLDLCNFCCWSVEKINKLNYSMTSIEDCFKLCANNFKY